MVCVDWWLWGTVFVYACNCGGGGGGGGGSSTSTSTTNQTSGETTITGNVIKGPLQNALVFSDYNGDGILSEGEPSTRTAIDGSFSVKSTDPTSSIVSIADNQTFDTITGKNVSGLILKAPSGSKVVTPITTLLVELKEENPSIQENQVANALGLSNVDIKSFNPFGDNVSPSQALIAEKIASQIIAATVSIAEAAKGAGANSNVAYEKAFEALSSEIVSEINDGNPNDSIDLTNTTVLTGIKNLSASFKRDGFKIPFLSIARFIINFSFTYLPISCQNVGSSISSIFNLSKPIELYCSVLKKSLNLL